MSNGHIKIDDIHKKIESGIFPESWEIIQLKDFLVSKNRVYEKPKHNFKSIGIRSHGKGTFLKKESDPNKIALKKLYKVEANDLIVNITFAWEGAIAIASKIDDGSLVSHRFPTYEINKKIILPEFLQYIIIQNWFVGELIKVSPGSAGRNRVLKKTDFLKIYIPKPSLPEQRNISIILGKLRKSIEKSDSAIQSTVELKNTLLHHLFTYGPVPIDKRDSIELHETEIGLLPKAWEVKKIEDLFKFTTKPRSLNIKDDEIVPFISMKNISKNKMQVIGWENKKRSSFNSGVFAFKNDLVVAKITPCFENGKQAILDNIPSDFCYLTTEVFALNPKQSNILTSFLFNYLKLSSVRTQLAGKMTGTTGRQRLSTNAMSQLFIPVPDIQIQKEISKIIKKIDITIEKEENKKQALQELFRTLLEKLMTGQIRVNELILEEIQT